MFLLSLKIDGSDINSTTLEAVVSAVVGLWRDRSRAIKFRLNRNNAGGWVSINDEGMGGGRCRRLWHNNFVDLLIMDSSKQLVGASLVATNAVTFEDDFLDSTDRVCRRIGPRANDCGSSSDRIGSRNTSNCRNIQAGNNCRIRSSCSSGERTNGGTSRCLNTSCIDSNHGESITRS